MVKMVKMANMQNGQNGRHLMGSSPAFSWGVAAAQGPQGFKTIYKYDITATNHLCDITGPTNRPVITFEKLST